MSRQVSIIDYGMSNLLSICRAFEHIGAVVKVVNHIDDIGKSDYLVLPGVGAFPDGMNELNKRGLTEGIREFAAKGKPLLGVCLGMQMLLGTGHEHRLTDGLGLIPGEVLPLPKDIPGFKVPNINWHSVEEPEPGRWERSVFHGLEHDRYFYFVHSYYAKPADESHVLATTAFGNLTFASAVQYNNIVGTQFHPEKSGLAGLKLLRQFLEL